MKRKGFTLIELLVVIAVIALLLAIIMPALSKAKMFAQEVICKSNLHSYHIATEVYLNENEDRFPYPWESLYSKFQFNTETERYCRWHNPEFNLDSYADKKDTDGVAYAGPYWPYLNSTKANICPIFKRYAPSYGASHYTGCIGAPFEPQFSYSMNGKFDDGMKRSQIISSPSQTFLWAEENMWKLQTTAGAHLSENVLNDNALLVHYDGQPTSVVDCFGSYHKISVANLAAQQPADPSGYGTYNGGVANVLFVDGSLTFATPLESSRYEGRFRR